MLALPSATLLLAVLVLAAQGPQLSAYRLAAPSAPAAQAKRLQPLSLFGNKVTGKPRSLSKTPGDVVRRYFEYWNVRDMESAVAVFSDDCVYEDTLYPGAFDGKEALKTHLFRVAVAVPDSFQFIVDTVSEDSSSGTVGVQWHVESAGNALPFTRGCSMYTVNKQGQITKGFDVPEPTVKSGSLSLGILRQAKNLIADPARVLPLAAWGAYCWLLFLSDVAPGLNALTLDPATWQEVRDLSLNFWLVLPIAQPDVAPVVHPLLEGAFNLVLAWAGLFGGFLVDGKKPATQQGASQQGENSMLVTVAGMQLLTNAMLLPYLVGREAEGDKVARANSYYDPVANPLSQVEKAAEGKALPLVLGAVGAASLVWGALGRPEFGDLATRAQSFGDIVGRDRLSFSFLVDLLYFSLFQGWLIDDDLLRRGRGKEQGGALKAAGSYVPFFGLVFYLLARPPLPTSDA
ncbi:hypothetical protein B484DRAFT_454247 [Ochromonadaceae sp. CCMP2298]|nr:hypothetical protein B484DRAFT_454247 [Ochromonadaceae sp. CCMP2298]|mmetsp:Transcript_8634/g.19366  ORF Transcript_8634/g.19366 Transcript_8634/m.19366 type:complete len:460 (+) Transcript_8634:87-1466(+)